MHMYSKTAFAQYLGDISTVNHSLGRHLYSKSRLGEAYVQYLGDIGTVNLQYKNEAGKEIFIESVCRDCRIEHKPVPIELLNLLSYLDNSNPMFLMMALINLNNPGTDENIASETGDNVRVD